MKFSITLTKWILAANTILFIVQPVNAQRKERVQIKWYIQLSNDENDPATISLYEQVENYNNSQDRIEVVIDPSYAGCSFDATDSLLIKIDEGNPPDITSLNYSELWEHMLDIRPYLSTYDLSNADSVFFFKHKDNNKLLYLTFGVGNDLLYYNKSMFDSLNMPYPPSDYGEPYNGTDVWDMDKLEEIAMLLTLDTNGYNAFHEEFNPGTIVQYGYHWRYSNGMAFIKPFGQPQIVDEECEVSVPYSARQAYTWIREGTWDKHFILPGEENVELSADPLGSGKVGMVLTGSYYAEELEDVPFEWDIAPVPEYNGKTNIAWNTSSFGILNTCQHPDEALEVIFTIAGVAALYGTTIPTMKNLRSEVRDSLTMSYPNISWRVLDHSFERINPDESTGDALHYNMAAWRLANDMRDYLQFDPAADINGALDTYFIPQWEAIFADACTNDPSTGIYDQTNKDSNAKIEDLCTIYPNIVNSYARFSLCMPHAGKVKLTIYSANGQIVKTLIDRSYQQGEYEFVWTPHDVPAGMYFARFDLDDYYEVEKLIIVQ